MFLCLFVCVWVHERQFQSFYLIFDDFRFDFRRNSRKYKIIWSPFKRYPFPKSIPFSTFFHINPLTIISKGLTHTHMLLRFFCVCFGTFFVFFLLEIRFNINTERERAKEISGICLFADVSEIFLKKVFHSIIIIMCMYISISGNNWEFFSFYFSFVDDFCSVPASKQEIAKETKKKLEKSWSFSVCNLLLLLLWCLCYLWLFFCRIL